jgi:hypothetical protein
MDSKRKFDFFKAHKNSYTRLLGTTDLEYGGHGIKIWSFGQFLPQTRELR